MPNKKQNTITI